MLSLPPLTVTKAICRQCGTFGAKFSMGTCILNEVFVENFATGCLCLDVIEATIYEARESCINTAVLTLRSLICLHAGGCSGEE